MDFARLSESEQLARLARLARRALAAWGLGDAELAPVKYRENAVFRVDARDGARYALRVHRAGYRSDDEIRSEVAWMRALAEEGIATPEVVPTGAGDVVRVERAEGVPGARQCDLLAWVEGSPLGTLEQGVDLGADALGRRYRTIGGIAARLHAHGACWRRPAGFARPAWDAESLVGANPVFGRFEELPGLSAGDRATLVEARARTREGLRALGPPHALIHGDLIPDNLLVDGERIQVIDFDDCGFGWRGFERVTSLFPLLVSGGWEAGREGYLAGYRDVAGLPDADLEVEPSLVMARALSYLGWPAGRPEIASQQALVPFFIRVAADLARRYLDGSGFPASFPGDTPPGDDPASK